jgi:hypothetical protein
MDDGMFVKNGGITLCTDNFTYEEVFKLKTVLENKFNLICTIQIKKSSNRSKSYNRIYISSKSLNLLKDLVFKYLHPSMYYKLHILNEDPLNNPKNIDTTLAILKDEIEQKGKPLAHAVKVEIFDNKLGISTIYKTITEASLAINCSDNTIRYHLKEQAKGRNKVLIKGRYFVSSIND